MPLKPGKKSDHLNSSPTEARISDGKKTCINNKMSILKLTQDVYQQIKDTLGAYPPECGGVLGATNDGVITEFYFDATGKSSINGYAPNIQAVNKVLSENWMPRGIWMVGIVHSHFNSVAVPSCGDISYGIRILQSLDTVDTFYLPIVTIENGVFRLSCFEILPDPDKRYICKKIEHIIV